MKSDRRTVLVTIGVAAASIGLLLLVLLLVALLPAPLG